MLIKLNLANLIISACLGKNIKKKELIILNTYI